VSAALDRAARRVLPDAATQQRHDAAVFDLRASRDAAVASVPDFEALRDQAAAIKAHTLDHLDRYLEQFEAAATEAGAQVHWAENATAHNAIVLQLLQARGAERVVKSKSILTEECGLNPFLEGHGIEIVDTDLGERIIQLLDEPPSHIVAPALHRTRYEVGALFAREMGSPEGESDPKRLTEVARRDLRPRFLAAQAGITGANFVIAQTGSIVVVTNEGNADLGMSLPPVHIVCVGIEKLLPGLDDLAVLLRLLARSATGQPISAYTSLVTGPRSGAEMHIVLVDNGRTRLLAAPEHRSALACIRCGACLNTCPVYRRAGGYSYQQTVPGPIGAVLAPIMGSGPDARELPHASSLCGSCTAVCPVKIDLHGQLLAWRRELYPPSAGAGLGARIAAAVLLRPRLYRAAGWMLRLLWPLASRRWPGNPAAPWLESRALPTHPGASFAARYRAQKRVGA
jgi:L-lactate dehydrogenase complex protein LldF